MGAHCANCVIPKIRAVVEKVCCVLTSFVDVTIEGNTSKPVKKACNGARNTFVLRLTANVTKCPRE